MAGYEDRLAAIKSQLKKGVSPPGELVHVFLGWFGAERRGWRVVSRIRSALDKHGISTQPDFEGAYYYGSLNFVEAVPGGSQGIVDPTSRLSELQAANRTPLSVTPDDTLKKAVSTMLAKDYSQLPVMSTPRDLKGVISWKSIAIRLVLGKGGEFVRDHMDSAVVVSQNAPLFDAIKAVANADYAIVQAKDKSICGIVTATDFNEQFLLLAEPFLLVGEIERGVRNLLHGKFTAKELESARAPGDERTTEGVADLTFGEYVRLLQNPDSWKKVGVGIDKTTFCAGLERVRDVRNDVMHFSPEGIEPADISELREFAEYLRRLRSLGAI